MRRIGYLLLAAASLLNTATAATRPRYGGTLRVAMQAAPNTLEVAASDSPVEYWASARIITLLADNLVKLNAAAHVQPGLALGWQCDTSGRRCQFTLRHGMKFHDGSPASATAIAKILGDLHSDWVVRASGDTLTIESDGAIPSLLAELALPRNAIVKRTESGLPIGTGPFRVAEFQPAHRLKLAANEESWAGRPFLDEIDIDLGRSLRDQAIAMELGKTDVIEILPQSGSNGARTGATLSVELMALAFPVNTRAKDSRVRDALALSINRRPIQTVLLHGVGEPTASILPNWMTGYGGVFSTQANLQRATSVLADSRPPALALSYDPRDPQAQLIADRIALNAREANITVQVTLAGTPDVTLIRVVLPSPDPATCLREVARQLGMPAPTVRSNSVDDLYASERSLLDGHTVIPLFHLPAATAVSTRVRAWDPSPTGEWNLSDVWLEAR